MPAGIGYLDTGSIIDGLLGVTPPPSQPFPMPQVRSGGSSPPRSLTGPGTMLGGMMDRGMTGMVPNPNPTQQVVGPPLTQGGPYQQLANQLAGPQVDFNLPAWQTPARWPSNIGGGASGGSGAGVTDRPPGTTPLPAITPGFSPPIVPGGQRPNNALFAMLPHFQNQTIEEQMNRTEGEQDLALMAMIEEARAQAGLVEGPYGTRQTGMGTARIPGGGFTQGLLDPATINQIDPVGPVNQLAAMFRPGRGILQ